MAALDHHILEARVQHSRLWPKQNSFAYRLYYLALDIDALDGQALSSALAVERFGLHSFLAKDHGARDGSSLRAWADALLDQHGAPPAHRILLVTLPRVLGFVFNPVSFWLCFDQDSKLITVISEVNNTFGQTHAYVCPLQEIRREGNTGRNRARNGGRNGGRNCQAKTFHVSPFLAPSGSYTFRFSNRQRALAVAIDHRNAEGRLVLTTSLVGRFTPLSRPALWRAFARHPFVTAKVVSLIHWQALRLLAKGQRFLGGPERWSAAGRKNADQDARQPANSGPTQFKKTKGNHSHVGFH